MYLNITDISQPYLVVRSSSTSVTREQCSWTACKIMLRNIADFSEPCLARSARGTSVTGEQCSWTACQIMLRNIADLNEPCFAGNSRSTSVTGEQLGSKNLLPDTAPTRQNVMLAVLSSMYPSFYLDESSPSRAYTDICGTYLTSFS